MGKNDFFLEPDDAQTMGDINYMRMAKKVRKTFPKTLKNPDGFAIEKTLSSSDYSDFSGASNGFQAQSISNSYQPQNNFNSAPAPQAEFTPISKPERKVDTSMDMFRNMAKNIKKGK